MNRPPWRIYFWEKHFDGNAHRNVPIQFEMFKIWIATMIGMSKLPLSFISLNMVVEKTRTPVMPVNWLKNVRNTPFQVLLLYFGDTKASFVLISEVSTERLALIRS